MLFAIYARSADTCGNEATYLAGYYQAETQEAAEHQFPKVPFGGYYVQPIQHEDAQTIHDRTTANFKKHIGY